MSGLDVEALLESTAAPAETPVTKSEDRDDRSPADASERRDRDRSRERRRRRDRSRDRRRDVDGDEDMKSPRSEHGSANGSHRSRKRSRSRDSERRRSRRDRDDYRSSGDFYRGPGRARSRSRSPYDDRHYRPSRREREEERRPRRDREGGRRRSPSRSSPSKSPELNEDERDKRTIFVQQLAARLRTKELMAFFEQAGPVKEAQIVKDRVSGRSKGYVERFLAIVPHSYQLTALQCRLCRVQERRVRAGCDSTYRAEASRHSHYCAAYRSRKEPPSSQPRG